MKIALFGANGMIGQRILREALSRGHQVIVVARDPKRVHISNDHVKVVSGDALSSDSIAAAVKGHDAVISAIGPGRTQSPEILVEAARCLTAGVKKAGVKRLLIVGGTGSLYVAPGVQLADTPDFPAAYRPSAYAHRDALEVYRSADLDWTFISPAGFIQPGERTGHYRTGKDDLLTDVNGESRISAEDYAVALLDELEKPHSLRQRMTAAY